MSSSISAIIREIEGLRAQDISAVNQHFTNACNQAESADQKSRAERERALLNARQTEIKFTLDETISGDAANACGDKKIEEERTLEIIRLAFELPQTWKLFCETLPLTSAIKAERALVVAFLLEKGVDYKSKSERHMPAYTGGLYLAEDATKAQQEIYSLMKTKVLRDMVQASEIGNLAWFQDALKYSKESLINSVIPEQGGLTPMMVLARDNHLALIRLIHTKPARRYIIDFSIKDTLGKTMFEHAFELGHKELIEWIITTRKMVLSELEKACKEGDLNALTRCLERGDNPPESNNAPLIWATIYGHPNIVRRLILEPRIDVKSRNEAAMIIAARYGYTEIVQDLIIAGADPMARNGLPLKIALAKNHAELKTLLSAVHSRPRNQTPKDSVINRVDPKGYTPLHNAVSRKDLDYARYLISLAAMVDVFDLNPKSLVHFNWHVTPLQLAAAKGDAKMVVLLLLNKAKVMLGNSALEQEKRLKLQLEIRAYRKEIAELKDMLTKWMKPEFKDIRTLFESLSEKQTKYLQHLPHQLALGFFQTSEGVILQQLTDISKSQTLLKTLQAIDRKHLRSEDKIMLYLKAKEQGLARLLQTDLRSPNAIDYARRYQYPALANFIEAAHNASIKGCRELENFINQNQSDVVSDPKNNPTIYPSILPLYQINRSQTLAANHERVLAIQQRI